MSLSRWKVTRSKLLIRKEKRILSRWNISCCDKVTSLSSHSFHITYVRSDSLKCFSLKLKTLRNCFSFERNRFGAVFHVIYFCITGGRVVPLLQLACAENGKCKCASAVGSRQSPENNSPLLISLILVGNSADHKATQETTYRTECVGDAEYSSGKIRCDIKSVS